MPANTIAVAAPPSGRPEVIFCLHAFLVRRSRASASDSGLPRRAPGSARPARLRAPGPRLECIDAVAITTWKHNAASGQFSLQNAANLASG